MDETGFLGLGRQLSGVLKALDTDISGKPVVWTLKQTSGKIYLDIVWTKEQFPASTVTWKEEPSTRCIIGPVKGGVKVEQIKRANKLYTNDSVFLRSTLSVPVGDQPLPASVLENATASANTKPIHGALQTSVIPENSSSEDEEEVTLVAKKEESHPHEEDPKRDTTMDFFNRIDRELRQEKSKMAQIESTSNLPEFETLPSSSVADRSSAAREPERRSSTPGMSTQGMFAENSYQHGTVRMSVMDRRRSVDIARLQRRRSADIVAMPNFSRKGGRSWANFWRWGDRRDKDERGWIELTDLTNTL